MSDEINYRNNPLHGVSLKNLLIELVDHYGFDILFAYLNINCFKTNPSIESSVKFLKKTDWAREKVESFYLYQFKSLPQASSGQLALSPRDRIIPDDQTPGEPAELNLEDAERLREKRVKKASEWNQKAGHRPVKRSGGQRGEHSGRRQEKGESHRDFSGPWKGSSKSSKSGSTADKSHSKGKVDPWGNLKNKPDR